MEEIIKLHGFTKFTSQEEIEETLLEVPDFSPTFYNIKSMNVESWAEAAEQIFNELQSRN